MDEYYKYKKKKTHFRLLTTEDIVNAVRHLPDKQCMSDPLLTRLLKENVHVLAPFLKESMLTHLTFECDQCDKTFMSHQGRTQHRWSVHGMVGDRQLSQVEMAQRWDKKRARQRQYYHHRSEDRYSRSQSPLSDTHSSSATSSQRVALSDPERATWDPVGQLEGQQRYSWTQSDNPPDVKVRDRSADASVRLRGSIRQAYPMIRHQSPISQQRLQTRQTSKHPNRSVRMRQHLYSRSIADETIEFKIHDPCHLNIPDHGLPSMAMQHALSVPVSQDISEEVRIKSEANVESISSSKHTNGALAAMESSEPTQADTHYERELCPTIMSTSTSGQAAWTVANMDADRVDHEQSEFSSFSDAGSDDVDEMPYQFREIKFNRDRWNSRQLIQLALERPRLPVERLWKKCVGVNSPSDIEAQNFVAQVRVIRLTHRRDVDHWVRQAYSNY